MKIELSIDTTETFTNISMIAGCLRKALRRVVEETYDVDFFKSREMNSRIDYRGQDGRPQTLSFHLKFW